MAARKGKERVIKVEQRVKEVGEEEGRIRTREVETMEEKKEVEEKEVKNQKTLTDFF